MSWWTVGDDVLGDEAADAIAAVCQRLAVAPEKPSLGQLVAAAEAAILKARQNVQDPDRLVLQRIAAAPPLAPTAAIPPALVRDFELALHRLAEVYRTRWNRAPRVSEVLAALAFQLRVTPRSYVASTDVEVPLSRLTLEDR